jgi:hypothetical protein
MIDRGLAFMLLTVAALQPMAATPARAQDFTPVTDEEKSDVLVLRNGDTLTGDFRELERGMVTFKTDAASTIYVKWPRVVTASTDKRFEIDLDDGRVFVGSLAASQTAYRVLVRTDGDTVEVAVASVVKMIRIKKTFFERLDGSVDAGFNFTQQNTKVDLSLSATVQYDVALNRIRLDFDGTFSRQDSVSDIQRRNLTASYTRLLGDRWIWAAGGGGARNSQLGLEQSWSLGTGPGRLLVMSNKVNLGTWIGLYYRTEQYVGDDARNTVPLSLTTDFQWFTWSGLSTDVSSRLVVSPILNDRGRWQINFTASVRRELLSHLYLNLGVTEIYDSKPPSDVNKNDFAFTSSLGWTF